MTSPALPTVTKFKLFSRSRTKSPAPRKRDPPPVLTFGPPSPQDRWEAESDGEAQEFHSHEAAVSTWEQSTPMERVLTAPAALVHSPFPRYPLHPLHPQTPSHTAQFRAPSPVRPGELQHPFSATYERKSLETENDQTAGNLRKTRKARPAPIYRDTKEAPTRPQTRAISPDTRQQAHAAAQPSAASGGTRGPSHAVVEGIVVEGEEVDLDLYPWFLFKYGESEDIIDTKNPTEGHDYSFISL